MARVKTQSKHDAILEAATRVFSNREFHEVLTDEIAAEAGIGKGTIYRYFETKDDLYFGTIIYGFERLNEALLASTVRESSPIARLETIVREMLRFFWNRRDFFALLYRNEKRFLAEEGRIMKSRERLVKLVQKIILEGIERREFRGIDAKTAAEFLLGMIRAANVFRRDDDNLDEMAGEIMNVFLHGIGREPQP